MPRLGRPSESRAPSPAGAAPIEGRRGVRVTDYRSDYLSLTETLAMLDVGRDNFRRAIEEGKIGLRAYLRSGHQPFLADFLFGLFHVTDKEQMNVEVEGHLNCDKSNGGARLLADLLDVRKDGSEWSRRYNLHSKLHMLKPWEGWFIAFPHQPLWGDWQNVSRIEGTECIVHPEQLGDDDVAVGGVLIEHNNADGHVDQEFPHFSLFGIVRLTPDTLVRWARSGRFISPVRVTPPSWWTSESPLVPWKSDGTPKNYFSLRYPCTEGYTDTPAAGLSSAPQVGWHAAPTDDDLLFLRLDVEALRSGGESVTSAAVASKSVPVGKQNEVFILSALQELGFDAQALPPSNGIDGAKKAAAQHEQCLHLTSSQFKDAWRRLRKDGRIKDALV
uniref:Uncharacterized protein n=1 Tax=Mycena chlorophos TaxID=658473 RepID=A0ABQ0KYR1_MYCCL|nr:predicted protein [Mycena chlorophos]